MVVFASVSFWVVRAEWAQLQRLSILPTPELASSAAHVVLQPVRVLALVLLALGLADYGLRYFRFEAMLRTTAEEHREDQRMMEGDLSLRARRRRTARSWRGDAPGLLTGATAMVTGNQGLTIVLAGGPPPRRMTIRSVGQGNSGLTLRSQVSAAQQPRIEAHELAWRLAQHAARSAAQPLAIPGDLMVEIAALWPGGGLQTNRTQAQA
jgi:flagellar biosynthetic protein FlhB